MKVIITKNHLESCNQTAKIIIDVIKNTSQKTILGLATGGTAESVYDILVAAYKNKEVTFKNVHTVNLDEYVGLSGDHDQSYRYFMDKFLFNHVDIDKKNTFVPNGIANQEQSLKEFQDRLQNNPRDFQLLGIGPNGHIAFNEPSKTLHSNAHIIDIADATVEANSRYFASKDDVPKKAFTQGMGDILKAKKIALLATGANKAEAIKALIFGDQIDTEWPCTFLKLHNDVTVFIDQELADSIGYKA